MSHECKALGCSRRTASESGYCFQHSDMAAFEAAMDRILVHKPKPKSKPARKRARRAKKITPTRKQVDAVLL